MVFLGVVESLPLRSLLLVLNLPVDWHFVENGSAPCRTAFRLPGLRVVCLSEKFQFFVDLYVLLSARRKGDTVGEHHSIMVLLAAPQRLAETVVAYEFPAPCEYVVNPHADCARHRLRVECAPVDLARLEFHNSEAVSGEIAELVVAESEIFRVSDAESLLPDSVPVACNQITGVGQEIGMVHLHRVHRGEYRDEISGNPLVVRYM